MAYTQSIAKLLDVDKSTTFALGLVVQAGLALLVPWRVAMLPAVAYLIYRLLAGAGPAPNTLYAHDVAIGRHTAQFPQEDGSIPAQGSQENVVVFILSSRLNHDSGSETMTELNRHFDAMWADAEAKREEFGYLGGVSSLHSSQPRLAGMGLSITYWRTLEGLHAFAHAKVHRDGWDWWGKAMKGQPPHVGILHELYVVPAGNWENIAENMPAFGMGMMKIPRRDGQDGFYNPLFQAKGRQWGSMLSRMGRTSAQ